MGKTMRAAVYRAPGRVEVVEVDRPEASEHRAVVEVSHCGICGTDLHLVLDGWGRPDSIGGHEWSGVVVEAADADLLGRRVVGGARRSCGRCRHCRAGRSSQCAERGKAGVDAFQGAFAQWVAAPVDELVPVPDGLDLRTAALAEPLAVALHAVTQGAVRADDDVLVFGAGPIGAGIIAALGRHGQSVRVVEPSPARARLAASLGATVVDPASLITPPLPMDVATDPADVVFECSGRAEAMTSALGQLERTGRLVLVGTGMDQPSFDPNRILLNELEITGAFNYDDDGFEAALGLLADPAFPAQTLIEPGSVALDELLPTMQRLGDGQIAGKVMVQPT